MTEMQKVKYIGGTPAKYFDGKWRKIKPNEEVLVCEYIAKVLLKSKLWKKVAKPRLKEGEK